MHEHLTHSWSPTYITLSYIIATLASFAALQLATRAGQRTGASRTFYLLTQGLLLGFGIWAMHFIGMLAWEPNAPVGYDLLPTVG
ncbi:MHYT domain-containing protein, partial [Deinococcus pimensis]